MDRPSILLIEDDPLLHCVLEEALEEAGFAVRVATTGISAIEQLEADAETFKGLITDVRLGPGPSGWEVARRARELVPLMSVVYMSGDSAPEWTANGVPNSIMLSKPFALAQAVTAVTHLLNDASALAARVADGS